MKKHDLIQGSSEWVAFRQNGIGSSDIAAICGLSPFKKAIDVFNEKLSLTDNFYETPAMTRGTFYEGEARHHHNKTHHKNFFPLVASREDYPHFFASLDGYDEMEDQVLEIKVPMNGKLITKAIEGVIDDYYIAQMQWQLYVTEAKSAIFAVYWPEKEQMYENLIERDEVLIEHLKKSAHEFWDNFKQLIPPPSQESYIYVELDDSQNQCVDRFVELKRQEKQIKEEMNLLKSYILNFGDDGNWESERIKITNIHGRVTYDIEAIKLSGVDLKPYEKKGKPSKKIEVKVEN